SCHSATESRSPGRGGLPSPHRLIRSWSTEPSFRLYPPSQAPGPRTPDSGPWTPNSGPWTPNSGPWTPDSGLRTPDSKPYNAHFPSLTIYTPVSSIISDAFRQLPSRWSLLTFWPPG